MAKKDIKVYSCGSQIKLGNRGDRNIKAEITAICLRPSHIRYEATWWADGKKNEIWVAEQDFTIVKEALPKKLILGFRNG